METFEWHRFVVNAMELEIKKLVIHLNSAQNLLDVVKKTCLKCCSSRQPGLNFTSACNKCHGFL